VGGQQEKHRFRDFSGKKTEELPHRAVKKRGGVQEIWKINGAERGGGEEILIWGGFSGTGVRLSLNFFQNKNMFTVGSCWGKGCLHWRETLNRSLDRDINTNKKEEEDTRKSSLPRGKEKGQPKRKTTSGSSILSWGGTGEPDSFFIE